MVFARRAFTLLLALCVVVAMAQALLSRRVAPAAAPVASQVARPLSLPEMALGSAIAPVTIIEYASPTCPHCAAFNREVFPRLKAEYVDTGKVRYVLREFPRNIEDAACAMLARTIAKGDSARYFAVVDILFRRQDQLVENTVDTLKLVGRQAGLSGQAVEDCLNDRALLEKISADSKFAREVLKVDGTPTFFVNGETIVGGPSIEAFEQKIDALLKG